MSTFQKFRKSHTLNKSSSQISRQSRQSQHQDIVTIRFSTNEIVFHYQQSAQMLISRQLQIINHGSKGIYFRIVGNNSQYYQILPSQDILYCSTKVNIVFRMKKSMLAINPRESYTNTFQKVRDVTKQHIFYVQWSFISDQDIRSNAIPELKYQQVVTVKVVQPYFNDGHRNDPKRFSQSRFQEDNKVLGPAANSYLLSPSNSKSQMASEYELQVPQNKQSLLRTPIVVAVAAISFLIGFICA